MFIYHFDWIMARYDMVVNKNYGKVLDDIFFFVIFAL